MTTQPKDKDMEQLKKEARKFVLSYVPYLPGWMVNRLKTSEAKLMDKDVLFLVMKFIEKAHLSGRESMRDECVEGAREVEVELTADDPFGNEAIASALKKIKL